MISPFSILFPFAAAVVVSLLSAWLPVRRASRLPIKDVVMGRAEGEAYSQAMDCRSRSRSFYSVNPFTQADIGNRGCIWQGIVPSGDDCRCNTAGSAADQPALPVAGSDLRGNSGETRGRLSARNMRDNKNTAQNITLLFISISAVIVITVVGSFVTAYVGDVFKDAELQGFADGTMDSEFVTKVGEMEGIEKVLPLYVYKNQMQADGAILSRLEATGNLEWYNSMMALHYTDKEMEEQALLAFAGKRAILFSESGLDRIGCSVGIPSP